MPGIMLDKKYGVNAHLTICPQCGGDGDELILTGNAGKWRCESCDLISYGKPKLGKCPQCKSVTSWEWLGVPPPEEKLMGQSPCRKCQERMKVAHDELAKGGVPWRCLVCKSEGVIKADTDFSRAFIKEHGDKAGCEMPKDQCPVCSPKLIDSSPSTD